MLLFDRQKIIKIINLNFKKEKEKYNFNSCKSDNNMQLKK